MSVDSVVSEVKGVQIKLDTMSLGYALRMPTIGIISDDIKEREFGLRAILERDDVKGIRNMRASQLSVKMMQIHYIISRSFFWKMGRFDFILERDIILMCHIIKEIPLSLPPFIIGQCRMQRTGRRFHYLTIWL